MAFAARHGANSAFQSGIAAEPLKRTGMRDVVFGSWLVDIVRGKTNQGRPTVGAAVQWRLSAGHLRAKTSDEAPPMIFFS